MDTYRYKVICMSHTLKCPICHGNLVNITPIISRVESIDGVAEIYDTIGYNGYCVSMKCKVYKVTFDKYCNVIGIKKYKDIQTKRRVVAKILEQNWDKYSYKTKKKLWQKYERAKKYL